MHICIGRACLPVTSEQLSLIVDAGFVFIMGLVVIGVVWWALGERRKRDRND